VIPNFTQTILEKEINSYIPAYTAAYAVFTEITIVTRQEDELFDKSKVELLFRSFEIIAHTSPASIP
jgi:hypothetical protein